MKYSYNWLRELSKTTKTPKELAELLTMKAFEVEGIESEEKLSDKVVVGKILEIQKHPNADKLSVATVDVGEKEPRQIVFGQMAKIEVGQKMPVALAPAILPGNKEIKEVELRGVKSQGMLCLDQEIGLEKEGATVTFFNAKEEIGTPVAEALHLNDTMMEIKVLPDRSHDALSHAGMAREISALEGKTFVYEIPSVAARKSEKIDVKIQDKKICSRYMGAVIEGAEVKNSPMLMKILLKRFGINPINNIVDATNYAMLETGQPLHAFDLDKLAKKNEKITIKVRNAKEGEEIKLLDGNVYKLTSEDIVIADSKKAIALAGIMGGADSAITDETRNIVLESANFDAVSIRKTRVRLNIITDASIRFEKSIDPNLAEQGISRAIEIIKIFPGTLEGINDLYVSKMNPWKIKLDLDYVQRLLGEIISAENIAAILGNLGLEIKKRSAKFIEVAVPTIRLDLKTQEDLIEEIGRINGYEKIISHAPEAPMAPAKINEARFFERYVKRLLIGNGFSEVYNYAFYSEKDADDAGLAKENHLELQNPINPEQALMRTSLIPNMLKNVRHNLKYFKKFRLFEMGSVFYKNSQALPNERKILAGMLVLEKDQKSESFLEMKGFVNHLLLELGIDDHYYNDATPHFTEGDGKLWHSGRSAEIKIEGSEETVGFAGEVHPVVLKKFGIKKRVAMFEFDTEKLRAISEGEREYEPLRKFPEVERDIALIAKGNIKVDDILKEIYSSGGKMVLNVDLFDIFDFEDGTSSYAFHILLGAAERTLESGEIENLMKNIAENLEKKLKVKIRS